MDGVNSYPITAVAGDSDGAFIRINDSSALSLSAYFNGPSQTGDDGEGGDLVVLIQTTATTAPVKISISADTTRPGPGGGYINMAVPSWKSRGGSGHHHRQPVHPGAGQGIGTCKRRRRRRRTDSR